MANYHLEIKNISRKKGLSVTSAASYISGCKLYDCYNGRTYYHRRDDVLYSEVFKPQNTAVGFADLQYLCNQIDKAEKRCDARTARGLIGSLPNELPPNELVKIVREYVEQNFISQGLCAIAAIHEGRNAQDTSRNNPHAHIIVSTRTVGPDGFNKVKDREQNNVKYIRIWRKRWADVQNRAYERNGLDIRVSHESLKVQGIRREPVPHLSRIDWQREQRGERTPAGDKKREIERRNKELTRQRQLKRERTLEIELSR